MNNNARAHARARVWVWVFVAGRRRAWDGGNGGDW